MLCLLVKGLMGRRGGGDGVGGFEERGYCLLIHIGTGYEDFWFMAAWFWCCVVVCIVYPLRCDIAC